jgi:hypothetical protein
MIQRIRNGCFFLLAVILLAQPVLADTTAGFRGDGSSQASAIAACEAKKTTSNCNMWCFNDYQTTGNGEYFGCNSAYSEEWHGIITWYSDGSCGCVTPM